VTQEIKALIDKPYIGFETYQTLQTILNKSSGNVSFFGQRYISIPNSREYKGYCSMSHLFARIEHLVNENFDFSEEERKVGRHLINRIKLLDRQAAQKITNGCFLTFWFTGFLTMIREELEINFCGPRYEWNERIDDAQDAYFNIIPLTNIELCLVRIRAI
jgi:hypothetical protein